MKYECDLIRDIAVLYRDHALSPKSEQIVSEHLAVCAHCRSFYKQMDESGIPSPNGPPITRERDFALKIRRYRTTQIILFCMVVITMLTTLLPWFGYGGVAEISGAVLLRHPSALTGLALLLFGIWYNFQRRSARLLCGGIGWSLLIAAESLEFLTIPQGSTVGITIGMFSYDVPQFSGISLADSFQFALPGFYVGVAATLLCGIGFLLFVRRAA